MTKDQMCDIIDDFLLARWPDLAIKGSKHFLTPVLINEVFYPRMREFRMDDAREGAREMAATRRFPPIVEDWVEATAVCASKRIASQERQVVDCPYCKGSNRGMIFASCVIRCSDDGDKSYEDFGHPDQTGYREGQDHRYSIMLPCGCENTPRSMCKDEASRQKARAERAEVLNGIGRDVYAESGAYPEWWDTFQGTQKEAQHDGAEGGQPC